MRVETKADQAQQDQTIKTDIDISLRGAPEAAAVAVPVDQIMVAVESVRGYVVSHLARIGRASDADDVLQDIRVAVWDGVARGRYRQLPGVPFGAWVQGVCTNVCAAHIRWEMSHKTYPLLGDPAACNGTGSLDAAVLLGIDRDGDRSCEQIVDQEWARTVIELTRASVSARDWELALGSLSGPRRYGPPSPQDRRRWHAATVVRQTARTVENALEVEPEAVCNISELCEQAAACLPTVVLRRTAALIVRPGVCGLERAKALQAVAAELGVTERYVAVQIGFARRLYQASWRIIHAGMQRAR
jgi:DNA-directed RNA polymerase specialized sigma24 family protein